MNDHRVPRPISSFGAAVAFLGVAVVVATMANLSPIPAAIGGAVLGGLLGWYFPGADDAI